MQWQKSVNLPLVNFPATLQQGFVRFELGVEVSLEKRADYRRFQTGADDGYSECDK